MSAVMNLENAHAILRVSYRGNKRDIERVECDSEASMLDKIKELEARSEVIRISVFTCHRNIDRTEQWVETPYIAPASKRESNG